MTRPLVSLGQFANTAIELQITQLQQLTSRFPCNPESALIDQRLASLLLLYQEVQLRAIRAGFALNTVSDALDGLLDLLQASAEHALSAQRMLGLLQPLQQQVALADAETSQLVSALLDQP